MAMRGSFEGAMFAHHRGMDQQLASAVDDISGDCTSGSSELLLRALAVLEDPRAQEPAVRRAVAVALCRAQPSMAPLWNAAAAALAGDEVLERFGAMARHSVTSIARQFTDLMADERDVHIVTFSWGSTVRDAVISLARSRDVSVTCGEGRPAFEGRLLATALARAGLAVTLVTDAAVATALSSRATVVFGADALASTFFVNKVGTRSIAAAAFAAGTPVYVLAGRDKLLAPDLEPLLTMRSGSGEEVWPSPFEGVTLRNPYYEQTSLDLVTAVVTDAGVLDPPAIPEACLAVRWRAGVAPLKQAIARTTEGE